MMPDKSGAGGWRKRIHARPSAVKMNSKERVLAEEDAESLRPPSERPTWRNTINSRPATPRRISTPTVFQLDTEEARREAAPDIPSPRKATKPKLARYLSGYLAIKDASKDPEFVEYWTEMAPGTCPEVVDPLVSLQSVYSHMTAIPTRPIPLHYNSGLFRIFEDYRKVREEKERVEVLLQETLDGYKAAAETWSHAEAQYQEEIRRLELHIVHGTPGISGLMRARQGTVVKRQRTHRKTVSCDDAPTSLEHIPVDRLDEHIRIRSQKVLLRRPVSPSGKMAALSKHFVDADATDEFTVGTPPSTEKITLSRKVQSEVDLANLRGVTMDRSNPHEAESVFSGNGDPLPEEMEPPVTLVDSAVDVDAFVALQELGVLVARKKGINAHEFIAGLMRLYSMAANENEPKPDTEAPRREAVDHDTSPTPELVARSKPQIRCTQARGRHFSFEPGDDQMAALEEVFRAHQPEDRSPSSDSVERGVMADGQRGSPLRRPSLRAVQKQSKIPSPIQHPGLECIRREGSESGAAISDDRRDSRSSVLTAFRQNSSGSLRPMSHSGSGSSSVPTLHGEGHGPGSVGSLGGRRNMSSSRVGTRSDKTL